MPPKNKTACKRRKCERSRSQRRRNNNRQNRTVRGGGWRSPRRTFREWREGRAIRAAESAAESATRRATNVSPRFNMSPLRWARDLFTRRRNNVDDISRAAHNVRDAQTIRDRNAAIRDLSNITTRYNQNAATNFDNELGNLGDTLGNVELASGFNNTSQATNAQVDALMKEALADADRVTAKRITAMPAHYNRKPRPPSPPPRGPRPNVKVPVPTN